MTDTKIDVKRIFLKSLRLYFAPLVGAWTGAIAEIKRVQRTS
jgi:hypothetical protein